MNNVPTSLWIYTDMYDFLPEHILRFFFLSKAGGHIGQNVVNITIKISKLRFRNSDRNIFVLKPFKANGALQPWTEFCHQILVVKKYKPYEIYWRICDANGKACFSQKVNKLAKYWFATTSFNLKSHREETYSLIKKKFQAQRSIKVMLTVFGRWKNPSSLVSLKRG